MKYEIYLKTRNRNNFEIFVIDIEKNNWFEKNVIWFVFFFNEITEILMDQ